MQEDNKQNAFDPDKYLKQINEQRKQLRAIIRDIMQKVTGEPYAFEDNLHQILKTFSAADQKSVNDKLRLVLLDSKLKDPNNS